MIIGLLEAFTLMNELPTKPGPYYWRETDGDKWELWHVLDNGSELTAHRGFNVAFLPDLGGQWLPIPTADELVELQAKAKMVDYGQEAEMVFDHHNRVRHLGSIIDYAKLLGFTVTHLRMNGYTCEPATIVRKAKR